MMVPMNGAEERHLYPANLSALSVVSEPLRKYSQQLTFVRGIDIEGGDESGARRT